MNSHIDLDPADTKAAALDLRVATASTPVRYHSNAAELFAALGGTARSDAILLESADIESKKNTACMAVLEGCLRVTCYGHDVYAEALTDVGVNLLERLRTQLAEFPGQATAYPGGPTKVLATATFHFPPSHAAAEHERLVAPHPSDVLRCLQSAAGYSGKFLPFLGGGFAFDFLETFETLPAVGTGPNIYPDYQFVVAETFLSIDHLAHTAELEVIALDAAQAAEKLATWQEKIATDFSSTPSTSPQLDGTLQVVAQTSDAEYREIVQRLQGNIECGDIYQVVPARSFTTPCPDAFAVYRSLRATNPSPYMFYVRGIADGKSFELFGASPESNLKFDAATREVQIYPIAGTRPRGLHPDGTIHNELDIRSELDMRTDAKEIAEHIMLVDLARNDLARVAVPATRKVVDLLQVDRYSRVMHLVSRIVATLAPDFDSLDAYKACMNMGTLTGAPKIRATELLRATEKVRRGSYGGAVGYLRGDGTMDTCIVIRSGFVHDGQAVVQAGAGVVRDSQPQKEADETLHKAYAVLHALAQAAGQRLEVLR
ncbi:MAG: anthranilate synthase component 1 [Corynebacterium sp.]|nr:anthranilate synthase component 1 [Corynebacterium sp.]